MGLELVGYFTSAEPNLFDLSPRPLEPDMSKRPRKSKQKHLCASTTHLGKIRAAAARMKSSRSRYSAYRFLSVIYRTYWSWVKQTTTLKQVKALALQSGQRHRNGRHAFRTMLEAADCSPEAKVLSRWSRALEYALDRGTRPSNLLSLFEHNGGIAGCARLAAKDLSKRGRVRNDWL